MKVWNKIMEFLHVGRKPQVVHVGINLDRPLLDITPGEPKDTTHIKITGLSMEDAAKHLPGKSLDWGRIPREIRDALELTGKLVIAWEELKKHLK